MPDVLTPKQFTWVRQLLIGLAVFSGLDKHGMNCSNTYHPVHSIIRGSKKLLDNLNDVIKISYWDI